MSSSRATFRGQFIGSQADNRMYEVMEVVREKGYYEVEGKRYVIGLARMGSSRRIACSRLRQSLAKFST